MYIYIVTQGIFEENAMYNNFTLGTEIQNWISLGKYYSRSVYSGEKSDFTNNWFDKMSRQTSSIFVPFLEYSEAYSMRKERHDRNHLPIYPCVTCHYRVLRRRLYFNVETLAEHQKGVGKSIYPRGPRFGHESTLQSICRLHIFTGKS